MRRITGPLILALVSAGCGKKEEASTGVETEEYRAWKGSQAIRQMAAAGPSDTMAGTVLVNFPQGRSKSSQDFIELCHNGQVVQHTAFVSRSGGELGPFGVHLTLRVGTNWLDLWDSTTNKNYRFQINTHEGTEFVFTPTEAGYDFNASKRD